MTNTLSWNLFQNRWAIQNNLFNTYFIFARFMENIFGVANLDMEEHFSSIINSLKSRNSDVFN